jgi:hypothetical protein
VEAAAVPKPQQTRGIWGWIACLPGGRIFCRTHKSPLNLSIFLTRRSACQWHGSYPSSHTVCDVIWFSPYRAESGQRHEKPTHCEPGQRDSVSSAGACGAWRSAKICIALTPICHGLRSEPMSSSRSQFHFGRGNDSRSPMGLRVSMHGGKEGRRGQASASPDPSRPAQHAIEHGTGH